jgi:hypothetical protein
MAYKFEQIMKILTIIGGIVAIIEGIWQFFAPAWVAFWHVPYLNAIVLLILGILALLTGLKGKPIPFTWVMLLILGILILIFGSLLGGVLLIIAAILGLIK